MKLNDASRHGRTDVIFHDTSAHDLSRYEATHKGGLSVLEKSRPTPTWSRVSPAILGQIDHFVKTLAGRKP